MNSDGDRRLWASREVALEKASVHTLLWCALVGAGNAVLMWALWSSPFGAPGTQLAAGAVAMALHGWGAWEIGSNLAAWSRSSKTLAWQAAGLLRQDLGARVARERENRAGQGRNK